MRQLEEENNRLEKIVAELTVVKAMLQVAGKRKLLSTRFARTEKSRSGVPAPRC